MYIYIYVCACVCVYVYIYINLKKINTQINTKKMVTTCHQSTLYIYIFHISYIILLYASKRVYDICVYRI